MTGLLFRLSLLVLRPVFLALAIMLALASGQPARAGTDPQVVLTTWYRLVLELVRHTPTYSPPVAARAFAYLGITAYEATASGNPGMASLAGQLNALSPLPARDPGASYDEGIVLEAALSDAVANFFGNTGPTGQRAMTALRHRLDTRVAEGIAPDVAARSQAFGKALADHILAWSQTDGGAAITNMGFPMTWTPSDQPGHWVPTSRIIQQQAPLLPGWGRNRPLAMPDGSSCPLPPPPPYSEKPGSAFYAEAAEVWQASRNLTAEQRAIAAFWSDDPMLSPTPPGHWISILMEIAARDSLDLPRTVDALARLGIAISDGFIGCWDAKFRYDLIRPVTYIRKTIDPEWEPLLITPPFPEYPSGHSTQSGAAATVLTAIFGAPFPFTDSTHADDGLAPRDYPDFWAAANEAAISRLYGGIHFRAAIERGLEQGACIGAHVNALRTLE